MNQLNPAKRAQVVAALVEGNSIRATVRKTGVSKNAIQRLLPALGPACEQYQNHVLRNLPCKRVQCDEIWSFCCAKNKNVPADKKGQFGYGDVWTWAALCADTKLLVTWAIGTRGAGTAYESMHDLAGRLANRVQLTTDGHRVYLQAVESPFGSEIDSGMLVEMCMAMTARVKRATALGSALDAVLRPSSAILSPRKSLRALSSARTLPCVCRCAVLRT
jgi:hypothetical protein